MVIRITCMKKPFATYLLLYAIALFGRWARSERHTTNRLWPVLLQITAGR